MTDAVLIVGLGNPGDSYALHRHNVGFMAIDRLADAWAAPTFKDKFSGLITSIEKDGGKIHLLKPQTFMNLSGESVQKALQFYKLNPAQMLVIHDDIDLKPGEIRTKLGGGHGGHNGLRNIDQHVGKEYHRLRVGVGHPGHKDLVSPYVLSNFPKDDHPWLEEFLNETPNIIKETIHGI